LNFFFILEYLIKEAQNFKIRLCKLLFQIFKKRGSEIDEEINDFDLFSAPTNPLKVLFIYITVSLQHDLEWK
jgi:hypothetical protein